MKNIQPVLSFVVLLLCFSISAKAQLSHGGQPYKWNIQETYADIAFFRTPTLDMNAVNAVDQENDQYKEFGFRFGIDHAVSLNTSNAGTWTSAKGMETWRMGIYCPNALAISFRFGEYKLPENAKVFVYDANKTHFLGAFTSENNKAWESLTVSLIYSDHIIIELQIPSNTDASDWKLSVDQITHAYRPIRSEYETFSNVERGPYGNSGACNINVNCPQGAAWQTEKKAVALIVNNGSAICTGAMVNNTMLDGTPYFLTANHCLGNTNNWVFYFNHETTGCSGSNGPTTQSISGASIVSSNGNSDFGLLLLSAAPPANFGVYYAGWDNSDGAVSSATGIHHPSGDVKKICHETDAPYHENQAGADVWYIDEWEEGVTEGGSSGSPLFDQNHRIIGQLYGGWAACSGSSNNGEADYYGRFGVSWDGSNSNNRLRDWLDPSNSTTTLDGYDPNQPSVAVDAASQGIGGIENGETLCNTEVAPVFVLRNAGQDDLTSATINWEIDNVSQTPYDWTGTLSTNQTESIPFPSQTFSAGLHTIEFSIVSANGGSDLNSNNDVISVNFSIVDGDEITVSILTDDYASESSWEITDLNNTVVASGDGYSDATQYDIATCLDEGCYTFTIFDEENDGICCGWGNGNYELLSPNNDVMGEGGEFTSQESTSFCLPYGCASFSATTDFTDENLSTGGNNGTATVTVSGGTPPYSYVWSPGGGNTPTVNGLSAGDYTVTVTDASQCETTATVTIGNTVGLSNLELSEIISVFPNPTTGAVSIEFPRKNNILYITISDVVGKTIMKETVADRVQTTINFGKLKQGIYTLNFFTPYSKITKKVVYLK